MTSRDRIINLQSGTMPMYRKDNGDGRAEQINKPDSHVKSDRRNDAPTKARIYPVALSGNTPDPMPPHVPLYTFFTCVPPHHFAQFGMMTHNQSVER